MKCNCEHLKIDFDFGENYNKMEKAKCKILKEKKLFFFKVRKKCDKYETKNFSDCDFYRPIIFKEM